MLFFALLRGTHTGTEQAVAEDADGGRVGLHLHAVVGELGDLARGGQEGTLQNLEGCGRCGGLPERVVGNHEPGALAEHEYRIVRHLYLEACIGVARRQTMMRPGSQDFDVRDCNAQSELRLLPVLPRLRGAFSGDGRINENFGLTAVHHVWHENHNWQIDNLIQAISVAQAADPTHTAALVWQDPTAFKDAAGNYTIGSSSGAIAWNFEKMFQAAVLINQTEYQHVAIDQYARGLTPNIPLFFMYDTSVNADVSIEYSQAAFRFGHSQLRETIDALDPNGNLTAAVTHYALEQAFLDPAGFAKVGPAAIALGMTRQVASELDEIVTPALQQKLLGQPQDLAAINIARGRDLGIPTLNALRKELAGIEDEAARAEREAKVRAEIAAAHDQVKAAGGLFVIGTERHESRRIDNQLRGRSGRQGDPGRSRFFLSLEDDLMRIFGSDRMGGMLQKLGLKEGEAIVHPWINKALEKAQKKVEARNFDTRKNVLRYDDVMNAQRKEVYAQRKEFMRAEDVGETIRDMREEVIAGMVTRRIPEQAFSEQWELTDLAEDVLRIFGLELPIQAWGAEEGIDEVGIRERIQKAVDDHMTAKADAFGAELLRYIEKSILIQTLDAVWKEHLHALDHLRQGIGLRAYGQRDPLNEYKSEAFVLFNAMLDELKERVSSIVARIELAPQEPQPVQQTSASPRDAWRAWLWLWL